MSKPMDTDTLRRERLAFRYVRALDRGDLDAVEVVLDAALNDPLLSEMLAEIDLAYQDELPLVPAPADAQLVRELIRKHFHSAVAEETDPVDEPLTVGDVAIRLADEKRVPVTDREANRQLLGSRVPLPPGLSIAAVRQLAIEMGAQASERFWKLFRDTAIMLGIGHSHQQSQLAAAREQRHGPRADPGGDKPAGQQEGQE